MSHRLIIRPEADAEVYEASHWYEERRQGLGKEFLSAFASATANLRFNPQLHPIVAGEARRLLLRRFPYSVIYEIHGDEVVVLACFHESRDPHEWLRRL
ncbi:MAG TPA: type II toxin-antitoxin system RelE/ParE family toxin [Thermoanaerobaculia bacterium]|nr:type II toxin-antitoxin system RelE/ParE family toxin [Thermoanaerobaculia bacterium]